MTELSDPLSTKDFFNEHREDLSLILRNSDDPYLRAVAGALFIIEGETPDLEQVKYELELAQEVLG